MSRAMPNSEIAHFAPIAHASSGMRSDFYEFDEPLTVSLGSGFSELDIDPSPTAQDPHESDSAETSLGGTGAREIGAGSVFNNRFRIERPVGAGGSAMVFSATDLRGTYISSQNEPQIALKVLHPELRHHRARIQRLTREFAYMRRLKHPFIARVFDLQCDDGVWFMIMELLRGQSLSRYLTEHPEGLPLRQSLRILTECTEALVCAHQHRVCHGDLKPGNVLIDVNGSAHLIDFGSVPEINGQPQATLFATPAYASPQLLNQRIATPRDDLFSLGCVAYELFAGHHPFNLLSSLEARRQALQPQYHERIPSDLFGPIKQLLAWEREFRPADALEFLNALSVVEVPELAANATEIGQVAEACSVRSELPATMELSDGAITEVVNEEQSAPAEPRQRLQLSGPPTSSVSAVLQILWAQSRNGYGRLRSAADRIQPWQRLRPLFAASARGVARSMAQLESSLRTSSERVVATVSESASSTRARRDNVPLAAVAGVAALAFLVLHWSNAARAPARSVPTQAMLQQSLAALIAAPIALTEPDILSPDPPQIHAPPALPAPAQVKAANGRVWLTSSRVRVAAGQQMAVVNLRRDKSTAGPAPVSWRIAPGTAKPGIDYENPKVRIARFNDGQEIRTLFIPLKPAKPGKPERRFTIKLQRTAEGPEFGPITQTEVVIAGSS
jgi:serine/threonine protein kinase